MPVQQVGAGDVGFVLSGFSLNFQGFFMANDWLVGWCVKCSVCLYAIVCMI